MMVEFLRPPPQWGIHSQLIRMDNGLEWSGVSAPLSGNEFLVYRACNAYNDYKVCLQQFVDYTAQTYSMLQFTSVNPLDHGTWIQKSENKFQCVMNEQSGRLITPLGILINCTDPATNINWWTSKRDQDKFMAAYCADPANKDKQACKCFTLNDRIAADPIISKLGVQVGCRAQCLEAGVYRLQGWIDSLNGGNCANQCIQVQNIADINQQALIQDLNQTCTVQQAPPQSEPSAPKPPPPAAGGGSGSGSSSGSGGSQQPPTPPAGGTPSWPSSGSPGQPPAPPADTSLLGGLDQTQLLMIGGGALVLIAILVLSMRGKSSRRRRDDYYD
jgi:Predicted membrane protein